MSWPLVALSKALATAPIFVDGDWVESKDQDPDGDVRLIQLADVGDGYYVDKSNRFLTSYAARRLKCTFIEPGDILIARMPDPLGRACIFPGDSKRAVTVVDVCVIRVDPSRMLGRWLMHCINSPTCRQQIDEYTTGTTRQRISRGNLGKIHIPLPPLPEQRRIAAILDQAETLRTQRRTALAQLDSLTQSLFLDMFGDPVTNPKGWRLQALTEFFLFRTGKLDSNAATEDGEYPFFTCSRDDFRIDSYAFDCEALLLAGNNANADYSVKYYRGKFNAYQRTYVLTLADAVNSYAYARVILEMKLQELKRESKGSSTKYLTLGLMDRLKLPVPDPALQQTFATRVQAIEALKTQHRAALAAQDALFASLQQRAFAGAL